MQPLVLQGRHVAVGETIEYLDHSSPRWRQVKLVNSVDFGWKVRCEEPFFVDWVTPMEVESCLRLKEADDKEEKRHENIAEEEEEEGEEDSVKRMEDYSIYIDDSSSDDELEHRINFLEVKSCSKKKSMAAMLDGRREQSPLERKEAIIVCRELQHCYLMTNKNEQCASSTSPSSEAWIPKRIALDEDTLLSSGVVLGRSDDLKLPMGQQLRPSHEDVKRVETKCNLLRNTLNPARVLSRRHARIFAKHSAPVTDTSTISCCSNRNNSSSSSMDNGIGDSSRLLEKLPEIWVEDLQSTNGTFVDNVRLEGKQSRRLKPGQRLRLGVKGFKVVFEYVERVVREKSDIKLKRNENISHFRME